MNTTPQTFRALITQLERFDPDAPLHVETYVERRGCWGTDITDIVQLASGAPVLLVGVTANQWTARLDELRQKLERPHAKE
jgi:hypothetical protein